MIVSARTFAVLAALACGLMSACGSLARESTPSGGSGDSPIYASVSALARQSDAILVVEVGAVASREFDNGGDDSDGDPGVPMVFWHAEVVDVLVGQWGRNLVRTSGSLGLTWTGSPIKTGRGLAPGK